MTLSPADPIEYEYRLTYEAQHPDGSWHRTTDTGADLQDILELKKVLDAWEERDGPFRKVKLLRRPTGWTEMAGA